MAKLEGEDELKRKMRRRLVGAVALATALVIILPMVLESSPKPQQGGLELRIPDKDSSGGFTTQAVLAESAPDITTDTAPTPQSAVAASVSAPAAVSAVAAPKPAAHAPKPAPAPKPAAPAHKTEEHKAHQPGFAVQVGAFSHASSAHELQDKLRKQGWHAYTGKAGDAVRVRVGPYASRADAEAAQHKLEAQGVKPAAVVTEP